MRFNGERLETDRNKHILLFNPLVCPWFLASNSRKKSPKRQALPQRKGEQHRIPMIFRSTSTTILPLKRPLIRIPEQTFSTLASRTLKANNARGTKRGSARKQRKATFSRMLRLGIRWISSDDGRDGACLRCLPWKSLEILTLLERRVNPSQVCQHAHIYIYMYIYDIYT